MCSLTTYTLHWVVQLPSPYSLSLLLSIVHNILGSMCGGHGGSHHQGRSGDHSLPLSWVDLHQGSPCKEHPGWAHRWERTVLKLSQQLLVFESWLSILAHDGNPQYIVSLHPHMWIILAWIALYVRSTSDHGLIFHYTSVVYCSNTPCGMVTTPKLFKLKTFFSRLSSLACVA